MTNNVPPAPENAAPQPAPPAPYPGYAAAPAPYGAYPGQTVAAPTNSLAIVSLIAGIAGLTVVMFVGSIVAVITGHMALNKLKTSGEQGRGLALGGVITGWIGIAFGVLGIIGLIAFFAFFIPYGLSTGSI